MLTDEQTNSSYKNYNDLEIQFHRELMNSCRKYITHLNIVSIVGIIELVKQETIELEKATNKKFEQDDSFKNISTENTAYDHL